MALKITQKLYLVLKFSKSENKFFNPEFKRLLTTTALSALTPLLRLIKVGNVCFNFLLIICILSSQAISWQIPLFALFPQFPWLTFFLFPVISSSITSQVFRIWCLSGWHDHTVLNYHTFNIHNNTHHIPKNNNWHTIDQSHPTHPYHTNLHPTQPRLTGNSKFLHFTTVPN